MSTNRLSVDDIHGAWAIMPTPALPTASDWRTEDSLDIDETARAAGALAASGVDGIFSLGTFGEAATLTPGERRRFMGAAVEAVAGRIPFFGGATSLNTRETIRQMREARDLGADGVMLGVPMWCQADVPTAVQFYRDVAEAVPELAICIYSNPEAFKFSFPTPFWEQVAIIPQVVCSKYTGTATLGSLMADLRVTRGNIRLMPSDVAFYAAARIDPEAVTAFWSSGASCGPGVALKLRAEVHRAIETGDWAAAKAVAEAIGGALKPLFPHGLFSEFSKYNIGLEKERMNSAGWLKAGPCRPPYHLVPEEFLVGARDAGRRWADLDRLYLAERDGQ